MDKFNHKKSLGQNFLKDEEILKKISDSIQTSDNDLIIEVGPGQGALTKYLVQKKGSLRCFEIDERVSKYLEQYESDLCKVIYGDFLKYDLSNININSFDKIYFVGNLPYYITTPIIEKVINSNINVEEMVIMVQKEVAQRFAAVPCSKNYGSFTVFLNYYFDVELLFEVDRSKFDPSPNVDSAVVKFNKKKDFIKANDENKFFKLLHDSFKMKRKTIRNNLKNYDLEIIESILKQKGLSLNSRAEEIPLEVFIEISNKI